MIPVMVVHRDQAVVLMSGGIDSAACGYFLRERGFAIEGLFINYGQAAARAEERSATLIANYLGARLRQFTLTGAEDFGPGELAGRNAFLVFTALFVLRGQSGLLALGLHAGTPYYDCSRGFLDATDKLVAEHTDRRVSVVAPFITWTKKDIYEYFVSSNLPIAATYSCEAGTEPACGACASCRDREALGC